MGQDTESSVLQKPAVKKPLYVEIWPTTRCLWVYNMSLLLSSDYSTLHQRCLLIWAHNTSRGFELKRLAFEDTLFYSSSQHWAKNIPACTILFHHLNTFINHFWPCLWFQSSGRLTQLAWNKITPHLIPFFSLSTLFLSLSGRLPACSCTALPPEKSFFCLMGPFMTPRTGRCILKILTA